MEIVPVRRGRPPWVPPDIEKVEALAAKGLTFEQIAHALGIHVATLYKKKAVLRDFSDAIERGKANGIAIVANKLFECAGRGEHAPMIFFLKARAGWRDQGPIIEVNQNNLNQNINSTPAELESKVNLFADAMGVLRGLGVPSVVELPESSFRALPAPDDAAVAQR